MEYEYTILYKYGLWTLLLSESVTTIYNMKCKALNDERTLCLHYYLFDFITTENKTNCLNITKYFN